MRTSKVSLVSAIAIACVVAACGDSRYAPYCAQVASCEDRPMADCIESLETQDSRAAEEGCEDEVRELYECRDSSGYCDFNGGFPVFRSDSCAEEGEAFVNCP